MSRVLVWDDNFNGIVIHLNHRDVHSLLFASAPRRVAHRIRETDGWNVTWVSSRDNDFNRGL